METMKPTAAGPLNRYLSRLDVWALSLGCIIGWGAFVMPGTTFLPMAGPGGTVIAMGLSTLMTLVIGYNYFTLMKRYPWTGGVYTYSKEYFGRDHAFLSAWFLCLAYVSLIPQNATIFALICRMLTGDLLTRTFHYQVAGTSIYLGEIGIVIGVLVLIGLFAICLKPFLQGVQTTLGIVMAVGVLLIAVLVTPHISPGALFSFAGPSGAGAFRGILTIIILAPWAFVGFEVVSLETAHFRFSVKKSGKLIALAIVMGGAIYCVMAISAILRQPEGYAGWQVYVQNLDHLSGLNAVPTFYVLKSALGNLGVWIIAITALAAVTSSVIGFYRASARMLMNMARDRILADRFNKPSVCFLFLMVFSAIIALFGRTALSWIVDLSSLGAIVGFGYVSASVLKLSGQEGSKKKRCASIAGLVFTAGFGIAQLVPGISLIETMNVESYLLLAAWCLIGFVFYWRTMRVDSGQEKRNENVTIAALFILLTFSIMIWYVKKVNESAQTAQTGQVAIVCGVVLFAFILAGLVVMLLIHTQLKKRHLEAETARIQVLENSQAKSRFLFNMSHDIRTPMNAIIGYVNLARKEPASPVLADYLQKIDLSSQHMLSLVNDILEMSRIESGAMILEESAVDLPALFGEMEQIFAGQMQEKNIRFCVDAAQIRHQTVMCDKKNLTRVLMSLLSNAYKFTPEGGEVSLSLRETEDMQENISDYVICVKDTGIGMSEEFAKKMFTAFERERTSTDSGLEGTGLGLTITKSILDLMGASVEVETAPDQGTEITIRISFTTAETKAPVPVVFEEEIDFDGMRILLVEDNIVNTEIAKMILTQAGFAVDTAENGKIGADKVKEAEAGYYDAVLMDIQMPVMDGYEATRMIRGLEDTQKSGIPIIAMTANAFREDKEKAFEAGMQAHIAKPIDVDVMLHTIRQVLDSTADDRAGKA